MATAEFQPVFKPMQRRMKHPFDFWSRLVKDSFKVSTLALLGAIAQAVLFVVAPPKWAIVPIAVLTLNAVGTTIIQILRPLSNSYMSGSISARVTAQLPSRSTGRSGPVPATEQVVVFHIGAQYNHPLGPLAPGSREVASRFAELFVDLTKRADEYGLLGGSSWTASERDTNNTTMLIGYFRDVEGLNRFAHDPMHREAMDWWNKVKDELPHIGIFHETFVSPPGGYETIYHHMRPILMGRTSVRCKTEEGEAWVNPLVSADNTTLRAQYGRMGRKGRQEELDV